MSATFAALVVSATVRLFLDTSLTTRTARVGDAVSLRVVDAVVVDGVAIARDSIARGVVVDAVRPGRLRGRGSLAIQITSLTRPDGSPLRVSGTIIAVPPAPPPRLPADVEGPILVGMAAGYGTAVVASKVSKSAETIGRAGIAAGLATGILAGVLKRGDDLILSRGAIIEVTIARVPPVP
jgi:hypothetical protein